MKITLLFLAMIVVSYTIYAQTIIKEKDILKPKNSDRDQILGTSFPPIQVRTLSGINVNLPDNKPTIVCIVFEQNSQQKVDTWTIPILEKYADKHVKYYEIPMIGAGYKIASGFIDRGMQGGVPKDLHDNVATYYGKLNDYKTDLMMHDKNSCYLFLIDKNNNIKHTTEAEASPQKLEALYKSIEKL